MRQKFIGQVFFRFIFDTHRTGLHWQKKTVCGWGGVDQTVMSVRTGQVTSAEATHARTHTHKHTVLSFLKKNNKHFKLGALRSTCQENLHLRDKTEGAEALTGYQESEVCVKSPPRRQVTPVTTSWFSSFISLTYSCLLFVPFLRFLLWKHSLNLYFCRLVKDAVQNVWSTF